MRWALFFNSSLRLFEKQLFESGKNWAEEDAEMKKLKIKSMIPVFFILQKQRQESNVSEGWS